MPQDDQLLIEVEPLGLGVVAVVGVLRRRHAIRRLLFLVVRRQRGVAGHPAVGASGRAVDDGGRCFVGGGGVSAGQQGDGEEGQEKRACAKGSHGEGTYGTGRGLEKGGDFN